MKTNKSDLMSVVNNTVVTGNNIDFFEELFSNLTGADEELNIINNQINLYKYDDQDLELDKLSNNLSNLYGLIIKAAISIKGLGYRK